MTGNHPHPARDQIQAHLNDVRDDYLDPETETAPHRRAEAADEPVGVVKAFVWRNSRFDAWEWRCRERGCRHSAVSHGLAAAHFGRRSLHLAATAAAYHVRTSHRTGAPS